MQKPALLLVSLLISGLFVFGQQDDQTQEKTRSSKGSKKTEETVKKGLNFGILPTITFDSDLGFQYGALVNLFFYGDGSRYPKYNHSLYFEVSRFTKGSGINRFFYDSDRLLPGIRTSFDLSYITDQTNRFFGFNGYGSVYNASWIDDEDPENYHSRVFYAYGRKMLRIKLDLQRKFGQTDFGWVAGFSLYQFKTGPVDIDRLNKGKDPANMLPDTAGLYDRYVQWGIISEDEADGGWVNNLKAGFTYDSRDNEPNPMKGIWTEATILFAPGFLGNGDYGHTQISIIHRQYFTLVKERLSFAYRAAYQGTIGGKVPFYAYPLLITSFMKGAYSEGLGGAKTIRGVLRDRVVGKGMIYGNAELRWKFTHFNFIKQNWYIALSGFWDFGMVVQQVKINTDHVVPGPGETYSDYFSDRKHDGLHNSLGAGLHFAMNQNFIIACDYGMALNSQDGKSGLYIGLNFLF